MHSIKKAARREAWYNSRSEDGTRTYNIFGRVNSRPSKPRDEENLNGAPLQHVSTENDANSPIEDRRVRIDQQGRRGFAGPKKVETYPAGPTGNMPRSVDTPKSDHHTTIWAGNEDESYAKQERPGDLITSEGPQVAEGKPRKRKKMLHFMSNKKSEQAEQEDIADADTRASEKKKWPKPSVASQFKVVLYSWINILLVAVPVGIALEYAGVDKIIVFVVNFIAIIPLAAMLSYATEELAMYIGEVMGGLLNATFGNAVELIVSIIALTQGKILIVQTSLIGSMLSNLLLVMGMCFFFGGLKRQEQFFNVTVAQTAASLLALAIGSLIIPTAFKLFEPSPQSAAPLSRGTSILLLFTYGCYLFFQLRTHIDMYNAPSQKSPKRPSGKKEKGEMLKGLATMGAGTGAASAGGQVNQENLVHEDDEEAEIPQLSRVGALVTLAVATVLIALCAEFMVSAINVVAESVSQEFIGLILLPIVGNAAEHATAVTVAIKDKMDLAIGVAVGSSLQIALLVIPLTVMLNWWGVHGGEKPYEPMTLSFDGFQVSVLFIAIIVVNYLIQDGKSHWLEGVLLQITYLIIAIAAWFYPTVGDVAG